MTRRVRSRARCFIDIGDSDLRTLAGKLDRAGAADAERATGDNYDFTVKSTHARYAQTAASAVQRLNIGAAMACSASRSRRVSQRLAHSLGSARTCSGWAVLRATNPAGANAGRPVGLPTG